ncbi:nuclear transport factor 2 family protein [Candidatus Mycobacterium wuenschmannii]|uniref:Nuclear transport factor 2 family protein n=1 Tax=Candidatus Mycobacterium wuenschmannii TaxID=3027808 RepID=A0ABY8VVQ6_9MYCO|nr:nuclear transport factor 2 family protein [Candidatus Mycobacterium wuenschmannii]WIM87735.1 nuclear transport factor 2 family protein [Candidatus Mycobacterium wuenschmannii]
MHPFRKAVEDRDEDAIQALLADDVVFTSPVAFKPYEGKPITAAILRGVLRVFENFSYVREFDDSAHGLHALEFETGIVGAPGVTINGCDFIHVNADGLIDDFKVMVRPLSGATALSEAMGAQFPRIQQEAVELAGQFAQA